jgi:hypothetical protein
MDHVHVQFEAASCWPLRPPWFMTRVASLRDGTEWRWMCGNVELYVLFLVVSQLWGLSTVS